MPRALAISSAAVFVVSVFIQLIGYASTYVFAHTVGVPDSGKALWGQIQLYLIIASSINSLGDLRIGSAFVFYVSRGRPVGKATGTYFALRLAMVGLASIVLWAASGTVGLASTAQLVEILGLFMVLPILWSVSTVYTQAWVAQGDSLRGQIPLLIESIVRTVALIFVLTHGPTILSLTFAYLVGAFASTAYSILTVARYSSRPEAAQAKDLFRYSWPLIGSMFLLYTATNATPLIVSALFGTILLNLFSAANAFRILLLALPAGVTTPLFPHLSGLHARGEYEQVRSRTWQALRYTAMALIPGVMALVVYRVNFIDEFYGGTYVAGAYGPLAILALSAIPAALAQIIGTSLNSIGYQRLELYLTSFQVTALFASTALLIDPYRFLGLEPLIAASLTILASSLAALGLNTYFMERLLAVRIQARPILAIFASAALSFFAVSRFNSVIQVSRWYLLLLAIVIGFTVYVLVLAALGELSKQDIRQLGGSIGLPRSVREVLTRIAWRVEAPDVNRAAPGAARGLQDPPQGPAAAPGPSGERSASERKR